MRTQCFLALALVTILVATQANASTVARFPPPEFESGYQQPATTYPSPRAAAWETVDTGVLILALSVATWLALRRRSRRGIVLLSIFSLVYFGFYREGCVCPIGAIQDVSLAIADSSYVLPFTVIAFFSIPLVFSFLFGRVFCAGVCPLGAIQDLVLLRPLRVPEWLEKPLGILPIVYLGGAVLLATLNSLFLICRYDPFIAFFRFGGQFHMLVLGGFFLLAATFLARPYCRFFCPYRVLLGICSRVSWRHATITPDECVVCSLCEGACPVGAIRRPTPDSALNERLPLKTPLMISLLLIFLFGFAGYSADPLLARTHRTVQLASRIASEDYQGLTERTLESEAYRETGQSFDELFAQALALEGRFRNGGLFLGLFVGIAIGLKIVIQARTPYEKFYHIDREACVSCGRCFISCPRERLRLKRLHNDGMDAHAGAS